MISKKTQKYKKLFGFTLAEVLITLGIIGVVAALTIPIIINKISKVERNTHVKKMYSIINNALNFIKSNNNGTLIGLFPDSTTTINLLAQQLNYNKLCPNMIADGCKSSGVYNYLKNGSWDYSNSSAIILNTGEIIAIYKDYATNGWSTCNSTELISEPYCFVVDIDINGDKQPNQIGTDIFEFFVTKNYMTAETPKTNIYGGHSCDITQGTATGQMCTYNVLMGINY